MTGKYVIVRTQSAGVFAGTLESRLGKEVILTKVRRLWYWTGASSLSQLAETGTVSPETCKFCIPVGRILLLEAIEILEVTAIAKKSIESVKLWKM